MKYLFEALFKDDSVVAQTQQDISNTTEGKNAFYDVLQRLDEVKAFALYNEENGDEYLLNLETLEFVHNGAPFYLHDPSEQVNNIRLVYYKTNTILIENGIVGSQNVSCYSFGFQCNRPNGENQKFLIRLT